jgi:hypothetical protein
VELHCPDCGLPIPASEVAPSAGLAVCRSCDKSFGLEACKSAAPIGSRFQPLPTNPPKGVAVEELMDGFRLTLSTRSGAAFFLIPFMLVWSGFSLGGIYGTQIHKGEFDLTMSLFGIPFVLGTLFFGSFALMSAFGKVVLEVRNGVLLHRTGFLGLYWTRRRDWGAFDRAELEESTRRGKNGYSTSHSISLKGADGETVVGLGLARERLAWALRYLNAKLALGR